MVLSLTGVELSCIRTDWPDGVRSSSEAAAWISWWRKFDRQGVLGTRRDGIGSGLDGAVPARDGVIRGWVDEDRRGDPPGHPGDSGHPVCTVPGSPWILHRALPREPHQQSS